MRSRIHRKAAYACARMLCVALALLVWLPGPAAKAAEADGMLRVRLARLGAPSQIVMKADCDYTLAEDPALRIPAGTEVTLFADGDSLTLDAGEETVRLGSSTRLVRGGTGFSGITFLSPALSNRFCGDLYLVASGGVIGAALRIYIEDYLYGVVGCELPPSSGLEALKAQAIVARTYALRQRATRGGSASDLSDSGDVLYFRGYNDDPEYAGVVRAVDETRGQVVCYGDSPALCYFCESNGGQTESSANALGESLPYSVVMDDPYDLEGGGASRTATLRRDAAELAPALREALIDGVASQLRSQGIDADPAEINITSIDAVEPQAARYDAPSRLYRALDFTLTVNVRSIPSQLTVRVPTYGGLEDWYSLDINDGDNETVWVGHTNREYTVTFRRSGHGMGMSQRGALAMAKKGLDCATILDYYYPGTALRALDLKDAASTEAASALSAAQPIATARLSQKARLYEQADTAANALTTLPAGATVSIYAVQGEWAAVGSGDLRGFIHAQALTSFALVGVTATQVQDETLAQISRGPVDILQLPVETAMSLETLPGGATVRLDAYTDQWALVTAPSGVEGFIPRAALTLQTGGDAAAGDIVSAKDDLYGLLTEDAGLFVNADDSVSPRLTLERGTYVRVLAYNSAWAYVRTEDGESGYVELNCLSAVRQATPRPDGGAKAGVTVVEGEQYRYVSIDTLPLYKSYSTDSDVLATLKRGDRVQLGAYNDHWACVRANGVTGFVPLSGLDDAPDDTWQETSGDDAITVVEGEEYALVAVDNAPLYPSHSDEDVPLALLAKGDRVQLGAYNGQWACVRVGGMTGFVRLETLTALDSNP